MKVREKMRAMYYEQFGVQPEVKRVATPVISATSVLIRVMATGLCRSDWHGWMGHDKDIRLPHVPGHEFAGEIVALGEEVEGWKIGERVTTPFIQACGHCEFCQHGDQQVCEHQEQAGFTYWGSFADYVEVKNAQENLVRIPEFMRYEEAAVLGCRFGTAYRALMSQSALKWGDYALVLGCGGVGLSCIMLARAMGVRVAAVDLNADALAFAKSMGAELGFLKLNTETVREITHWSGQGVKACIDAIGHPALLPHGLNCLRRRGKYVQVGLMPDEQGLVHLSMEKILAHELEIVGSHG
ncbi:MAG: alcohol dehydrogenase catalytic domain-containing protein, partial [Saprospiraceae bacterium]|nr:alcohol dehydrogenase catalytic domain-containing protein [Saprospiraceae bacterium]